MANDAPSARVRLPRSRRRAQLTMWYFSVATFDIVSTPGRHEATVLLQPRPRLADAFPSRASEISQTADKTYIGAINDSLFAMSSHNFPLITLAKVPDAPNKADQDARQIEGPPGSSSLTDVATYQRCQTLECFTGARLSQELSVHSRHLRMISDHVSFRLPEANNVPSEDTPSTAENSTRLAIQGLPGPPQPDESSSTNWTMLAAFAVGLMFIWMLVKKVMIAGRSPERPARAVEENASRAPLLSTPSFSATPLPTPQNATDEPSFSLSNSDPEKGVSFELPPAVELPSKEDEAEGHSDKEGEAQPGKRRRRRRGKKKPAGAVGDGAAADAPVAESSTDGLEGYVKVDAAQDLPTLPAVDLPLPTPAPVPVAVPPTSSLTVSDTVLGQLLFQLTLAPSNPCYRLRIPWDRCLPRFTARSSSCRQAIITRLCHYCIS